MGNRIIEEEEKYRREQAAAANEEDNEEVMEIDEVALNDDSDYEDQDGEAVTMHSLSQDEEEEEVDEVAMNNNSDDDDAETKPAAVELGDAAIANDAVLQGEPQSDPGQEQEQDQR